MKHNKNVNSSSLISNLLKNRKGRLLRRNSGSFQVWSGRKPMILSEIVEKLKRETSKTLITNFVHFSIFYFINLYFICLPLSLYPNRLKLIWIGSFKFDKKIKLKFHYFINFDYFYYFRYFTLFSHYSHFQL